MWLAKCKTVGKSWGWGQNGEWIFYLRELLLLLRYSGFVTVIIAMQESCAQLFPHTHQRRKEEISVITHIQSPDLYLLPIQIFFYHVVESQRKQSSVMICFIKTFMSKNIEEIVVLVFWISGPLLFIEIIEDIKELLSI